MKALDTNALIRFLVQDDVNQADKLFSKAEQNKEVLFVPLLVVLEVIWVLQSAYSVTREDIIIGNK
jgi:predicted nucleic-acid-binding protein